MDDNNNQNTGMPPVNTGGINPEPPQTSSPSGVSTGIDAQDFQYGSVQLEPQPEQSNNYPEHVSSEAPSQQNTLTEVGAEVPGSPFQAQEITINQDPPTSTNMSQASFSNVPPTQGALVTNQSSKTFSKFKIFITAAVIVIIAIYSVVTFLYFQNKKLKANLPVSPIQEEPVADEGPSNLPTVVPSPVASADTVKILNGNVIIQASIDSESKILIDKSNYSSTGITGFARVVVSNDGQMLCFESWPPAPEPALYLSKSDGSEVKEVSPNRQNCLWSKDDTKLFYSDYASKTLSKNIYFYDIASEEEKNLTLSTQPATNNRVYDLVGLSADGEKIVCKYTEGKTTSGVCEVDLTTFEVSFPEEQ